MPANFENSAVATGLEKVCFHSNPKEGQCQRIFKLLYSCASFTYYLVNAQNPSRQASKVRALKSSRRTSWIQKRQRNQRSNYQHLLDDRKKQNKTREFQTKKKKCTSASLTTLKLLTVWITTNCGKEVGIPDHHTCLLRNLYSDQEATVRTGLVTTDWFKAGKMSRLYIITL